MSFSTSSQVGPQPSRPKWHFTHDEVMRLTPSRADGISYEEELHLRQEACRFLNNMIKALQAPHSLGTCVAAINLNRFYYFHSFKTFDYRDIAAACFFLAGKSEDCPRKLKHVVALWWEMKFPTHKRFPSEAHFHDASQLIVTLESLVLQTISFEMNVDLPHQHVLRLMQEIDRGGSSLKELTKSAYYLATDLILVTDWSIRFTCTSIAVACINIASFFAGVNISEYSGSFWFNFIDRKMTPDILEDMTKEFLHIYATCPHLHYGSLKRIDPKGKVKIITPDSPDCSSASTLLPPPPVAPVLSTKKLDMTTYKERLKESGSYGKTSTSSPRASFLPDLQNPQKELEKHRHEQNGHQSSSQSHAQRSRQHDQHDYHRQSSSSSAASTSSNHRHDHHHNGHGGLGHGHHATPTSHERRSSSHHSGHNGHNGHGQHSSHHESSNSNHHHERRDSFSRSSRDERREDRHSQEKSERREEESVRRKRDVDDRSNEHQPSEKRSKIEPLMSTFVSSSSHSNYHSHRDNHVYQNGVSQRSAHHGEDNGHSSKMSEFSMTAKTVSSNRHVEMTAERSEVHSSSNRYSRGGNGHVEETTSTKSAYMKMVSDMSSRKSISKPIDPSPPTVSPPIAHSSQYYQMAHQNGAHQRSHHGHGLGMVPPPPPPPVMIELEDGEVE